MRCCDLPKRRSSRPGAIPVPAARAAGLASIIGWTQRVVTGPLTDALQPAAAWQLLGAGWIDCGPASDPRSPWAHDVHTRSRILPPPMVASPAPWPLPQPLIEAMPRRPWVSPRLAALAHAIALLACVGTLAIWGSAKNNQALLTHVDADLGRSSTTPADHDTARRAALAALAADRDRLDRYARTGVPLRLSLRHVSRRGAAAGAQPARSRRTSRRPRRRPSSRSTACRSSTAGARNSSPVRRAHSSARWR